MFYSVFSNKDNTITNLNIRGKLYTGSNSGRSEILELYALTESAARSGSSRIVMSFDLTQLSESIVEGSIPTSSVQFNLKLKNAVHANTVPYSYDIGIYPLTRSFDEGRGLSMEDENLKDNGVSNWIQATTTVNWLSPGGDFISSSNMTASQHFDYGTEDLDVDISHIVYAWLTGGMSNNGLLLKYEDYYETGSSDYYVKKFFSRHALVPERLPKIEARWEMSFQDDRSEFPYDQTGSLGYYRFIGGEAITVGESLFVDILNSSSTVIQTITSSLLEPGIYEASGVFVSPTASTQIFRDVWFTSTKHLFTGTFAPVYATGSKTLNFDTISVEIPNLKPRYGSDENILVRVFAKQKNYHPAVIRKPTAAHTDPDPLLLKNAYYQIEDAENGNVIVPFSTGTLKYSKLSYDFEGNYFKLWTKSLMKNSVYKIKILIDYNRKRFIFDKNWTLNIRD